ncbi:hypothetical protein ACFSTD_23260 [Novosphingobium colocasiae]
MTKDKNESIGDRECVALNATTHAIIANLAARKQLRHNRVARLDGHSDTVGSEWRRVDVALFFAAIQQGLIMLGQSLCGTDCSSIRDTDAHPERARR